jgi:hypothetical protein
MDFVVVGVLVFAFAWLVTMHVAIAVGLARRPPRWRALVGLVVVPFAPYWAWHEQMRTRAILWSAAALVYVLALTLAFR